MNENYELFDGLDFEKRFLESLFRLLDDRLEFLKGFVNPNSDEESLAFDPTEHIVGVAFVAAQRYVAATVMLSHLDREAAFNHGPKKMNVTIPEIVNAAANYWKHIEDGEDRIREKTRNVLHQLGVKVEHSYCVSNVLHACGYEDLRSLLLDLVRWRDGLYDIEPSLGANK